MELNKLTKNCEDEFKLTKTSKDNFGFHGDNYTDGTITENEAEVSQLDLKVTGFRKWWVYL